MSGSATATAPDYPEFTNEFLNSLASVHSLSEILRDNPDIDSRQKQRFIDIILAETQRMATMVAELPHLPTTT